MIGINRQVYGKDSDSGQDAILLIHGLAGASSTWNTLILAMDDSQYQYVSNYKIIQEYNQKRIINNNRKLLQSNPKPLVFTLDFSDNQNLTFKEQGEEVALVIEQIRKDHNIGNILLIGHSMGGLAARAFINNSGYEGISGLITVTSPHLGSYLGYLRDIYNHCKGSPPLLKTMNNFLTYIITRHIEIDPCLGIEFANKLANKIEGLDLTSKAVNYLTPDSYEMLELNSHTFPGELPVINIVSKWETNNTSHEVYKKKILTLLTNYLQSAYDPRDSKIAYFSDALNAEFNDGIVAVSSQYMKLAITNGNDIPIDTYIVNSFHTESTKETNTIFSAINSILKTEQAVKPGKKSIVFILDSSGSMEESDPDNMRLNALASLAEEMIIFDNVFIIDFDNEVRWVNPDNYHQPDYGRLRQELLSIDSEGGTNIGQALEFTSSLLQQESDKNNDVTVVLLTDGMGEYSDQSDWFNRAGIPVYTISLLDNINEKLLDDIARHTNGIYFKAHSEFDIIDAYYSITSQLNSMSIIFKDRSRGIGLIKNTFRLEPGISSLRISIFSNNPISDISLIPPGSPLISNQNTDRESSFYYGNKIENPAAGLWTIQYIVRGGAHPLTSESQIMVTASAKPIVFYSARPINNNSIQLVENQTPGVGNIKLNSRNLNVVTPSKRTIKVETIEGEEITFYPKDGPGTYKFDMQLYGTINEHPFERFFTFSVFNDNDNQLVPPGIKEMIGNAIEIENDANRSEIGDMYLFYCIEPTNERLISKGVVTSTGTNNCIVELTETLSPACNNGFIVPVLKKSHENY
jgi:hypothetical protein